MLQLLPSDSSKTGWPWTEESDLLTVSKAINKSWPRITIVTPSFNQGYFIEETIRSIILQNYPNLEYIIIDGGSTDKTIEIIRKYEPWISYWVSEPDKGQCDAINKGFQKATGVYGNWINSDDLLEKNALWTIAKEIGTPDDKKVILGNYKEINHSGESVRILRPEIRTLEELVNIEKHWRNGKSNQIGQQATFFPLILFREAGMLNINNHYSMDYELWGRFLLAGAYFYPVHNTLGAFRVYPGQKISFRHQTTKSLVNSACDLVNKCQSWSHTKKIFYRLLLLKYAVKYFYGYLRSIIGIRRRLRNLSPKFRFV